jgi:excisionase family DNA binding protein
MDDSSTIFDLWKNEELLSVKEVASALKISSRSVYRLIENGRFEVVSISPRKTLILAKSVGLFLRNSGYQQNDGVVK